MGSAEEFGPYVVYEQLGLGGMATVHRAETQGIAGFSKQVALKRMLPNVAADANLVKSFIREARLASHLRHANVAQTYDLGKVGETYFIAMELVPGRNLREVLKHCAQTKRNTPLPIAINIVSQICDALDYAHNLCDETGQPLGIIHRDVSPSNIILGEGGIAKLIDFGIAKAAAAGMQTLSGTIKGKFSYMAPEYLMGHLDWRADLFAVGVIAHELLSNKPLFQGKDDMDTLYRVKDMPILPPSRFNPQVPPEIDNIVMTALERDSNRRWQQASAMRAALTTEAARLGLVAQNLEIEVWLDQTFAGGTSDAEAPEISVGSSTVELSKGSVPDDFLNVAADSMSTLVRPAGSQPIQTQPAPRAESPRTRPSQNVVPRGEFGGDHASRQFGDDPPTRADASAIDELAQSSLARRDDQRTIKGAGIDAHSQRTLVAPPPIDLLAHQNFSEETVANAEAMRSLAESPLARDQSLEAPTLTNMKRATTDITDADGVAAESKGRRSEFEAITDAAPRRPTPRPQPIVPDIDSIQIPDDVPTKANNPVRRDSTPMPRVTPPSNPPLPAALSGARTKPNMSAPPPGLAPQKTKLGVEAASVPLSAPLSGARTQPQMPRSTDGSSAIVKDVSVSDVLADLGHRPNRPSSSSMPTAPKSGGSSFLLPLLVLIIAGGAAAVVYFALPYFT